MREAYILSRLESETWSITCSTTNRNEDDHEAEIIGQGVNFLHIENWYSVHSVIRSSLRITGLYRRGLSNASRVQLRQRSNHLPQGCHAPSTDSRSCS